MRFRKYVEGFFFNQDLTLRVLENCTVFIISNPKLTLYIHFMLLTLFALTFYLREIIIQSRSGSNFRTASFMTLAHATLETAVWCLKLYYCFNKGKSH